MAQPWSSRAQRHAGPSSTGVTATTFSTTSLYTGRCTSRDDGVPEVPTAGSANFLVVSSWPLLATSTSVDFLSLGSTEIVIVPGFDRRSATFPVTSTISPT